MVKVRRKLSNSSPETYVTKIPFIGQRKLEQSKRNLELLKRDRYNLDNSLIEGILNWLVSNKRVERDALM
ncbi:hypothetical protein PNBC_08215 [Paenibacillus crassostreae]|uniref:Uncharacterized protein n=1 Tax=Paenibacillus crassostreae TaxID=1763538 RepID=A0A167EJI6_9BACL|nr:hypothetical protein LPB68_21925 [Paenibacillus crassostreae]OAB75604.1 hypothetical protein PNBC_08215 [Paenibacillus crassostreae]